MKFSQIVKKATKPGKPTMSHGSVTKWNNKSNKEFENILKKFFKSLFVKK